MAQAIRYVFTATAAAMTDTVAGSSLGLGNSDGAGEQTLEVLVPMRRSQGQGLEVAKTGKATPSIPSGMETEI